MWGLYHLNFVFCSGVCNPLKFSPALLRYNWYTKTSHKVYDLVSLNLHIHSCYHHHNPDNNTITCKSFLGSLCVCGLCLFVSVFVFVFKSMDPLGKFWFVHKILSDVGLLPGKQAAFCSGRPLVSEYPFLPPLKLLLPWYLCWSWTGLLKGTKAFEQTSRVRTNEPWLTTPGYGTCDIGPQHSVLEL